MKKSFFKIFSFLLLISALGVGCKKALEIDPRQSIDASTALNTRDGVNAAITGVYSRLKSARQYGRDLIAIPDALADNGFATNKSGRLVGEANNNSGAHITGLWSNSYAAINSTNLILESIAAVPDASAADKIFWEGQLLFLRALYHFDLVKIYAYMPGAVISSQDKGGVPLLLVGTKTSTDAVLLLPSRTPTVGVYNQIVKDLETANARLTGTGDVSIANKPAVQALLSRVNLYRKNYTEAKRWADSCINFVGSRLSTASTYVADWRSSTHKETIFQVRFNLPSENIGVNESLQTSYTTLVGPPPFGVSTGGFGDLVPTISLLNALGITLTGGNTLTTYAVNHTVATRSPDVRNLLYEPGTTGRGPRKVENTKFIGKNGVINLDNVPVIRISEVYLNRAEAMATAGSPVLNPVAALADLNTIATNRGLTAFAGLTDTGLYDEILNQRRIELAFEGHRFWDLKRLGRDLIKAPHYTDVAFTDFRILAPLPQREIDGNKNLVQNFNY